MRLVWLLYNTMRGTERRIGHSWKENDSFFIILGLVYQTDLMARNFLVAYCPLKRQTPRNHRPLLQTECGYLNGNSLANGATGLGTFGYFMPYPLGEQVPTLLLKIFRLHGNETPRSPIAENKKGFVIRHGITASLS
jgi:hypothetical protein